MSKDSVGFQVAIKGVCPVCGQMKMSTSDFQVLMRGGFIWCIYCGVKINSVNDKIYISEGVTQYE